MTGKPTRPGEERKQKSRRQGLRQWTTIHQTACNFHQFHPAGPFRGKERIQRIYLLVSASFCPLSWKKLLYLGTINGLNCDFPRLSRLHAENNEADFMLSYSPIVNQNMLVPRIFSWKSHGWFYSHFTPCKKNKANKIMDEPVKSGSKWKYRIPGRPALAGNGKRDVFQLFAGSSGNRDFWTTTKKRATPLGGPFLMTGGGIRIRTGE